MKNKFLYKKIKVLIFSFIQVYFVCLNIIFINSKNLILIFISSFSINIIWSFNIKKIAFGNNYDRLIYAFGAAFGSIAGILSYNFIKNILL